MRKLRLGRFTLVGSFFLLTSQGLQALTGFAGNKCTAPAPTSTVVEDPVDGDSNNRSFFNTTLSGLRR